LGWVLGVHVAVWGGVGASDVRLRRSEGTGIRPAEKPAYALPDGSRVLFAGDSIVRNVYWALVSMVNGTFPPFVFNHDSQITPVEGGGRVDYCWIDFATGAEGVLRICPPQSWTVIGFGLWDILHVHNLSSYGAAVDRTLSLLRRAGGVEKVVVRNLPPVVPGRMHDTNKLRFMNNTIIREYNSLILRYFRHHRTTSWYYFDAYSFYSDSADRCIDGVHYTLDVVARDALHIFRTLTA